MLFPLDGLRTEIIKVAPLLPQAAVCSEASSRISSERLLFTERRSGTLAPKKSVMAGNKRLQ